MYLINYLSLQPSSQLFSRFRTGTSLQGLQDGSNVVFNTFSGERFTHNLPFLTIQIYRNGQRLALLEDYMIAESGGAGAGYDTVILEVPPLPDDNILVDYVVTESV